MNLRDAFSSPTARDILYSLDDRGGLEESALSRKLKERKNHLMAAAARVKQKLSNEKTSSDANKALDKVSGSEVSLSSRKEAPTNPAQTSTQDAPVAQKEKKMTLTLKGLNRKGTTAIYSGAIGSVRIGLASFPSKQAPETIEVADGVFAVRAPKAPKVKLTKEERAALPKPTEAEKIAKMEERLARAKAKLAAQAAGSAQPEL